MNNLNIFLNIISNSGLDAAQVHRLCSTSSTYQYPNIIFTYLLKKHFGHSSNIVCDAKHVFQYLFTHKETPLNSASKDGRLDVVKYRIDTKDVV